MSARPRRGPIPRPRTDGEGGASPRAVALAAAFEEANAELVACLEGLTDDRWQVRCEAEGWPVGVTAHHVASAYPAHLRILRAIAEGRPVAALSWERLDRINARHAGEAAGCTRDETIALLEREARSVAAELRRLDDDELGRTGSLIADLPDLRVAQWIELVLIGHISMHLESIRGAAAGPGPDPDEEAPVGRSARA